MTSDPPLNLNRFETAELLWKINASLLTFDAHQVTPQQLRQRGVDTQGLPQKPPEFTDGLPYGLRATEDSRLSLSTLLNFLLLLLLPLASAGAYFVLPEATGWSSWLLVGSVFLVFLWILKIPYNQVFNRPDRLPFGHFFADLLVEPWKFYGSCIRWVLY